MMEEAERAAPTMTSMPNEDQADGEPVRGSAPSPDWEKINRKMAALPTLEKLLNEEDPNAYTAAELEEAASFVRDLVEKQPQDVKDIERFQRQLQKKYHKVFKKSLLLAGYKELVRHEKRGLLAACSATPTPHSGASEATVAAAPSSAVDMEELGDRRRGDVASAILCPVLEQYLISKAPRSQSGVLVVTVFTSPYPDGQRFSCQWNCYYCPNEPGQPRSYLLNEPGVRRANRLDFDAARQFEERVHSLVAIGHPADKVELLVLGGTWESYPMLYRQQFVRDLFYAANVIFDHPSAPRRPPLDLLQEQLLNEEAKCKIIGLTLETRPDTINAEMLVELRRFGCTRVQLGIQHTDDAILTLVNRQSTRDDAINAIKMLKDSCFKVDIHLMPDLPGATPAIDKAMFDDVLDSPYLQADQWKIYPCQTTPFTVIEQWHREGKYNPYGLEPLIEVLLHAKTRVHPWIRLNRVIRDIPVDYVLAGVEVANLRQLLAFKLRDEGRRCRCIRCREIKGDKALASKLKEAVLQERRYAASEGTEIFLSVETPDEQTLFGFLRLRLDVRNLDTPFPELQACALIRELHVYGNLMTTYDDAAAATRGPAAQHSGIGRRLLQRAEEIALEAGYSRIAVISGVGVRSYYRRWGYRLEAPQRGAYLIKSLLPSPDDHRMAAVPSLIHATVYRPRGASLGDAESSLEASGAESQRGQGVASWVTRLQSRFASLWALRKRRRDAEGDRG